MSIIESDGTAVLELEDSQKDKYLTFHIGTEGYAISIHHVTEIIDIQRITEVPETPEYIKGVINLRGKVIPVMDVRIRFGMEYREYDRRTCVIVVNYNNVSVGLVVDTVSEVVDIPDNLIDPSPTFRSNNGNHFVEGMGKLEDDIKMIIDVDRLLYNDAQSLTILSENGS